VVERVCVVFVTVVEPQVEVLMIEERFEHGGLIGCK
jgi:hypothetical protein